MFAHPVNNLCMKKSLLVLVTIITCFISSAQNGGNHIGIGATLGIPTGDFSEAAKVGFGGYIRTMIGVGTSGEVLFTTGYSGYGVKGLQLGGASANYYIIPILLGYRHNLNGFYLEPQLGIGMYGARATYMGNSETDSKSAFTWAAGVGYQVNNFDIGFRYQSGKIKDADSPISIVAINIGFNIPLKPTRTK
jgi:hypothetical protein